MKLRLYLLSLWSRILRDVLWSFNNRISSLPFSNINISILTLSIFSNYLSHHKRKKWRIKKKTSIFKIHNNDPLSLKWLFRLNCILNFLNNSELFSAWIKSFDLIEFYPAIWTRILGLSPNTDTVLAKYVATPVYFRLVITVNFFMTNRACNRLNRHRKLSRRRKDILNVETPSERVPHTWLK